MYQTVNFSDFCDAFRSMDRNENFSYEGKRALFDYLEQYEEDVGEPWELDVIGLCCDWTEYDSATEAAYEYRNIYSPPERDEDESDEEYADRCEEEALEWLQDQTTVIECDNGHVIIQCF
jgi:hypothetical protein